MDLFSAIETRTSCRQFLSDVVPPATIEQILAAAADLDALRVAHVLSREPAWGGDTGYIDSRVLARHGVLP